MGLLAHIPKHKELIVRIGITNILRISDELFILPCFSIQEYVMSIQ